MLREILIWPDPRLKKKSAPVRTFDTALHRLLDDMAETMYAAEGVGLAAPQVDVLQRILVIDTSPRQEGQKLIEVINPVLVRGEGATTYNEGCLSVPGEAEEVERFASVDMRFQDRFGKTVEMHAQELLAIAFQHEMDHLEGVLFVDRISALKRELIRRRMKKLKSEREHETPHSEQPAL